MLKKTFQIFNLLSLNVAIGAVFCSYMFWKLPDGGGVADMASLLLLGITTWIIYILDRLLDLRIYPETPTDRHRFHADNQYNLSVLLVALSILGAVLCFFIPIKVFKYGLILVTGLVIYFFVLNRLLKNKRLQWLKEPTTAICYVLAVVGTAFVNHSSINMSGWVLGFMFFLIASQNLLLFSYFERLGETKLENTVTVFGENRSLKIIRLLGFIVLFLAIFLFSGGWEYINRVGLLLAIMAQVLSFLTAKTDYFLKKDRYRWVGDGVFLLPIILVLG